MNGKKAIRVVLDTALTLMLVFEMFIQFTGEFLHEVVGFAFFATVVLHLALSAAWVKKTARNAKEGKMTARRTALAVVGSLLAVTMIILGVSSVAISGILSSAGFVWLIGTYAMWATVHAFSSYALCALVVVHLAMHWVFLASAFKVPYNPSRRRAIATGVNTVAALGVLALGSTAVGKIAPQAASAASTDQATAGAAGESAAVETANASGASAGSELEANRLGTSRMRQPQQRIRLLLQRMRRRLRANLASRTGRARAVRQARRLPERLRAVRQPCRRRAAQAPALRRTRAAALGLRATGPRQAAPAPRAALAQQATPVPQARRVSARSAGNSARSSPRNATSRTQQGFCSNPSSAGKVGPWGQDTGPLSRKKMCQKDCPFGTFACVLRWAPSPVPGSPLSPLSPHLDWTGACSATRLGANLLPASLRSASTRGWSGSFAPGRRKAPPTSRMAW